MSVAEVITSPTIPLAMAIKVAVVLLVIWWTRRK